MQPDSAETKDLFIFGVTEDSRDVRYGFLFCALPGVNEDGLAYCPQAAARGAQAIAVPEGTRDEALGLNEYEREKMAVLRVRDIRGFYGRLAADFHSGRPGTMAAVTGTNGKTSTVCFLRDLWVANGHNAMSLGKGHEDYQIVLERDPSGRPICDSRGRPVTKKIPFSDATIIREIAASL
jgi:UDP-N-acetylmuramoyl-L-alanyl-D-glutamate--2,6-diaminopimelate ligase